MKLATVTNLRALAVVVLLSLAFGISTKADSCAPPDCQTLTVLETLTHFTTVGAPTTVEWLFLDEPNNFEVIDTWQGGMFDNTTLSSSVDIGVPNSINLASLSAFTDTNTGITCCSSCPPGTPVTLEPAFPGGPDVPVCFDPFVHVYDVTFGSGSALGAVLVGSFIPEVPGTFIPTPEPGTLLLLAAGMFGLAFRRRRFVQD
jgi:PEP-CTERM motif